MRRRSSPAFGLLVAALLPGLFACGFSGDGDAGAGGNARCAFDFVNVCDKTAAPERKFTANTTLDTSNAATCTYVLPQSGGGPELCVIHAAAISISSNVTVHATGSRPLALISNGNFVINGILSAGSRAAEGGTAEVLGAGAMSGTCPSFAQAPLSGTDGGGGGAGGTFGGSGGNGGRGNNDTRQAGSAPQPLATPTFLRGGCRGQSGGDGTVAATGGAGGPPGGALLLAAHGDVRIALNARVAAGGGGGRGGIALAGAGGAGSGGMIVIEATKLANSGAIRAQGGGGGEGSQSSGAPTNGSPGADSTDDSMRADGAQAQFSGGGGHGSSGASRNGEAAKPGSLASGGGGGGGGAGYVLVRGETSIEGVIAPPPS